MKAILFVILNVSVCFPRGLVGVEILIPGGVWGGGGLNEKKFPGSLSLAMTPPATHLKFLPSPHQEADIQWKSSWCGHEGQSDQAWTSNKPIFFCRNCRTISSFPLNEFTLTQETQSSLNWFQRSITISQKKYFRRSNLQRCLTSLTEWPLVADRVLLSKSDSNFRLDFSASVF